MAWMNETGGMIRWIFKGCKTSLREEMDCHPFENMLVGLLFSIIVIILLVILVP